VCVIVLEFLIRVKSFVDRVESSIYTQMSERERERERDCVCVLSVKHCSLVIKFILDIIYCSRKKLESKR